MNILHQYANNGIKIANVALILTENGFLGEGANGFHYAGLSKSIYPKVKFRKRNSSRSVAEDEFSICRQMCAYRNPIESQWTRNEK